MIETIQSGIRTARKDHVCDFCGCKIEKGQKYNYQNNVYEKNFYTWKTHLECTWAADYFDMYDECETGLTGEDFRDFINIIFAENSDFKILNLEKFNYYQKVKFIYDKLKEANQCQNQEQKN